MNNIRYFICPMSKNIVDAVLQLKRSDIALLPSRRQIDFNGGYTKWTTQQFSDYVDGKVLLQRDHGGEGQGTFYDDGRASYINDANIMDIIHVDPWKVCTKKEMGLKKTIDDILFINQINQNIKFEVGTEQVIFPLSSSDLFWFISNLEKNISSQLFDKIEYVTIQSGTKLDVINELNIGTFNIKKLSEEISICKMFNKKSKEHNGDFLTQKQRRLRFKYGLSALNIGPELSIFENSLYIEHLSLRQLQEFNQICYESGDWKKWINSPEEEKIPNIYFKVCAHYNYHKFNLPEINVIDRIKDKILLLVKN